MHRTAACATPEGTMQELNRRRFVLRAASVFAVVPFSSLAACSDSDGEQSGGSDGATSGETEGSTTDCCDASTSSGGGSSSMSGSSNGTSTTTASSSTTSPGTTTTSTTTTGPSESSSETSGGPDETSTGAAACEITPSDIEGPFYRPGIPVGSNLDVHGDNGVALLLEGRVMDEGCTPLANAIVEIWHATPVAPGGEAGDVQATYDNTDQYRYYGQVATDDQGRYAFETLRPGWYLNGAAYRPAHVHLKVWVRGVERLTTQLYFTGDPFNDDDPWYNPTMALDPNGAGQATLDVIV